MFASEGIDVPLDEIARRAGVGTGTFYRHFADREALLDALFDERVHRFDAMMEAAAAEDAWQGLVELMETSFALQAADRGLKEILAARARGQGRMSQPPRETMEAINALLARAKADGTLRDDVVLTDMALIGAAINGVLDLTGTVAPDAWRRVFQIILDGLRADGRGPSELRHAPLAHGDVKSAMHDRQARVAQGG